MPMRLLVLRSCPALLFTLMLLFFGLTSCRTTSELTIEDAQKISAVGPEGIAPPPRADVAESLINPEYLSEAQQPCKDEPPETVDIDRVVASIASLCRSGYAWEIQYCLPDKLFDRGREAMNRGQYTEAIALIKKAIAKDTGAGAERYRPHLAASYAAIGDFSGARWSMGGGNSSLYRSKSGQYQVQINYAVGRASLERVQGNYHSAEKYYRKARKLCRQAIRVIRSVPFYDIETQLLPDLGEVLFMQGRLVEAELVLRESLNRFSYRGGGVNNRMRTMAMISRLFMQQGRFKDAEMMARASVGGYRAYDFTCSDLDVNIAHQNLARALLALGRPAEALEQFETIRHNMRHTPRIFKIRFVDDPDWAFALVANGEYSQAESMLANALKSAYSQYGDNHHRTAEIRGLLAVSLSHQSKHAEAEENFRAALPVLLKHSLVSGGQDGPRGAFNRRLDRIVEAYLAFVAGQRGDVESAAAMTFHLADAIRGQTVQQAVAASSTRIAARNPRLAELVRREQDAGKKISALNAVLLNSLSQTDGGGQRTESIEKQINQMHQAREVILEKIQAAFPAYAELTRPRPRKLDEVRVTLQKDEALLAYYLGENSAFVWSVPGTGTPQFTSIPIGLKAFERYVQTIRQGLQTQGATLDDLPSFDRVTAYQLYQTLLEPVHASWKKAKHLIIIPHGPLGHLPFALLPTASKGLKLNKKLPLSEYREFPWLIRDHSLTVLPSSGSLITLRSLPKVDTNRRAYAGFGDPVFNQKQALAANAAAGKSRTIATRAIRITETASLDESKLTSATLEMLQPLPDTREEVLAIATALQADVNQDVFLGQAASEATLKKLDLSNRRVLVFATHGLVPGDLDGLRQPALALSSPTVTGDTDNDGILTMGEIMGLRLNADWVVLSACNTAAGQGAGSEAVSGLGQAFFYAGTRALLVSNWPVESASAKLLTTELFRQQEADPTLSRAVALQKSMLKLLDTGVYRDIKTNQAVYAYAHPMFWAPFSLVGEGRR